MRHTPRVLVSSTVTGVLALGLIGSPAEAYNRAEKRAEKRQNSNIKKTGRSVTSLKKSTKATDDALGKLAGIAASDNKKNADTIAAVVPAVTTALTQLRDGLTAAGAGLGQLKTGLEAAGAGLTTLSSAFQSVEYGAARIFATEGGNPVFTLPLQGNTADIPDDSNGATITGTGLFQKVGGPGSAGDTTQTTDLQLRGAIRSNEGDGLASGDPAGQAGGFIYVKCAGAPNGTPGLDGQPCGVGGPAASQTDPGQIVCAVNTPTPQAFNVPGGATTQPLINIQQKAPRVGADRPNATDPIITSSANDGKCTLPQGGGIYEITIGATFLDLPTSASPKPTD